MPNPIVLVPLPKDTKEVYKVISWNIGKNPVIEVLSNNGNSIMARQHDIIITYDSDEILHWHHVLNDGYMPEVSRNEARNLFLAQRNGKD